MAGIWDAVNTSVFNPEKPNAPGVLSDVRRASGQFVSGVGSTLRDLGAEELGRGVEQYGTGVTRRNPSEIQSFEDVLSRPFTTTREAVGELVPQIGLAVGGGLAGRAVGGLLGAPLGPLGIMAGQQIGGVVGGLLPIAAQTYGGIRSEQREAGIDDRPRALGVTVPAAALERLGAERIASRLVGEGTQFLARETGENFWKAISKQALRGGFEETITEIPQTALERFGAYKPLTTPEALDEYGVAGAKAFLGGGAVRGGLSAVAGQRGLAEESDLTVPQDTITRPRPEQFVTADQTVGLKKFVDETTGIVRPSRKGYEEQFKAAFDEPSGQFVSDPATGVERELTAGELMQRSAGAMDLTQDKPAENAVAESTAAKVATTRDPRDVFLRDELKVIPNTNSRQLFTLMEEQGVDPTSPAMVPVWNYAAAKYMTPKRLEKATELMDAAIIESRKEAPIGTGVSTVQQPAGGLGVGSPVVQGAVGDAGRVAPVAGTVGGGAPAAGAPLQQTGILPSTTGQPSTPVTTTAPTAAPAPDTRFRRAPRPMTVLEAANAAQAAQAQQTETQGQEAPAAAGPVVDPRQATLQQIFGQRNGDIIFDVVGMGMPEPEAATKYGLSRQAIQKIAGATGQKTWPERIARAKTEFGLTDAKIAEAFNVVPQDELGTEVEREVFGRGQAAGAITETEAIEGGLENIVKTAGAGTAEVEGFTKLDKEIDATLEALAAETDEKVIAELMAKMADLTEKAKAVGKRKQAEVRRDAGKVTAEGEPDAVQVESPAGVSVQPETETGKAVGGQVRRAKKPAAEGKAQAPAKVLTEAEQAAQAWDVVAADFPQAPKFAELTKAQQENFIEFGPGNWERGDVELELTKLARTAGVDRTMAAKEEEIPAPKKPVLFSKTAAAPTGKNSVSRIVRTMEVRFGATQSKFAHRDYVRVHQTAEQAFQAAGKRVSFKDLANAQAFVDPRDERVVHLIADNIPVNHEFAVLLHEVGIHVGLKGQLGGIFKVLEAQVKSWANMPKTSNEYKVYEAAMARVAAGRLEGSIDESIAGEELVAYAAEEAVARGVKPQASATKKLENWLNQMKLAFEKALRNFFKVDSLPELKAQDLVNYAFASASKQMQSERQEPGAAPMDSNAKVMRYYAGDDLARSKSTLADDASIDAKDAEPGEESFMWGTNSKFGSFTNIGTRGFLETSLVDTDLLQRTFTMVLTSAESRQIGEQYKSGKDKILTTAQAVEDPYSKHWSVIIAGPEKNGVLYYELWMDDKASITEDNNGNEWSRLDGIPKSDVRRMLVEFRRRLTRAIGEVPWVEFTRVTGSGSDMLDGRAGAMTPENLATRFSKAPTKAQVASAVAKLPKQAQQPVRNLTAAIGDLGGKYLDYAVFTNDLVKRAVAAGLPAAQTFSDRLASRNAKVSEEERKIEKIADRYASIEEDAKGSGPGSVNEFLFESTRTGKWGYGKYRDAKMGAAFDALGPKAQQFVKDVFAHGDATLSNKKKIVLDAANSEYDAMIKAAQAAGDTKTEASLKAEKAATLKRFQTLFRIREGVPYAPIKRTGSYVVIGESAEYQKAKANKDTATLKKLESDPDHYHVSFTDTKWQARSLRDRLAEQGVFTDPQVVSRSESFDEAFSGEAMLPALTKMRAAVDRRAQDATGKKDPTAGKLLNIINQLYLEALAEGSARKSEMRRRGVAGEVDMLQSFTQQGRADANFLASVEFEPKIQDALQQMRNQSRTGERERKSEIFDELTKRYAGTLDPQPSPFISGLTNMASKFFLASSPAYYMQNLTQPFMMSLPAMAGRHDYTKAASEMVKAYTELGPLFRDVKLFDQQFDFSKVPADVRTAINELVNQGKIDIGLATEINEYKVDADGNLSKFAQRLNKGMRMAVQKTEAVNRLSTAIAAYRLEFERAKKDPKIADPKAAATQYAADILSDTHGDYTAFNAPRAFNTQWGKVALQFRKFQLIQISFFYKLFRDAFTNPAERAAAIKSLTYALGHTAVFAGLMGLPGYAAISAILSAFGDEDEPYDLTADMRKALGPEWADMIMRGAPTVVGMDLSGKIGAGTMLSIMPFSNADLSTASGRAEAFGTLMGGASLGMTTRVADGLLLMSKGDYYKGLERVMPKGVSDALKSGRQATEGMTRRNGDVILPESEIGATETVLTGLGVPSVQQSVTYERQNRMRDITKNFQDRTTRIKNDYAKAVRQKDTAAMQEAREAWTKLQQARQRNGLKPQPVSNLLKAPQEQAQREKRTVGGVSYREGQRQLAEQVAAN